MEQDLPLPSIRCLSKQEAATYLGIGVTLFTELQVPNVKFGRRTVYDKVDLDVWLEEYKQRGRARKDKLWLNNKTEYVASLCFKCFLKILNSWHKDHIYLYDITTH